MWSFIHIDDAAAATVAALERGEPGIYNVVDDEPAPVKRLAARACASRSTRSRRGTSRPGWPGIVGGEETVGAMTQHPRRVEREGEAGAGWTPRYASWRDGFRTGLA